MCVVCFIQVMYLGVVVPPNEEHDFDGKVHLSRVSKSDPYKRTTYNQNFTDSGYLNEDLKSGEWCHVITPGEEMNIDNMRDDIATIYNLDADIAD